jgi:hypothetical protein
MGRTRAITLDVGDHVLEVGDHLPNLRVQRLEGRVRLPTVQDRDPDVPELDPHGRVSRPDAPDSGLNGSDRRPDVERQMLNACDPEPKVDDW